MEGPICEALINEAEDVVCSIKCISKMANKGECAAGKGSVAEISRCRRSSDMRYATLGPLVPSFGLLLFV